MVNFLNRLISWSFYTLFFFVPIVFTQDTSELFELNKIWLTFGLTTIIIAAWISKMVFQRRIFIQRTPLDIPILLFLGSQLISTTISLDTHTSWWGYYSRFNGGLLSLITYTLVYYAFVSNIHKEKLLSYLYTIILSGVVVALWGLPSHFGYDPTCLVFRGTFDVSCWTSNFQPKVRIFSTLGQPDWLSAYLAALIPLAMSLGMYLWQQSKKRIAGGLLVATLLFYLDFLYAKSRGGFVGLSISLVLFFGWYIWAEKKFSLTRCLSREAWAKRGYVLALIGGIALITFVVGTSIDQIDKFMFPALASHFQTHPNPSTSLRVKTPTTTIPPTSTISTGEFGGTDSGKIRLYVWTGAISAWLHYPIFGTGVETFAYAYYLFMPPAHNLTSEFGYLYNKAHNEYLNYLATTGIVGLGTYLFMISMSAWLMAYGLWKIQREPNHKLYAIRYLPAGLLASYLGILIINFFGFSVVIVNLFLFLFPGFVLMLQDQIKPENEILFPKISNIKYPLSNISPFQWILSAGVSLVALYFLYTLFIYWQADKAYALGQNFVNAGEYQNAYQPLHQAISLRPSEPTFQDELALDDAVVAVALAQQNKSATGTPTQLAQEAVAVSNDLVANHPNVVTYWKTRVRIMYALSQLNPQYLSDALTSIQKATQLAPTDAKVSYNFGLILGQTGHVQEAVAVLQNTIRLKKDYHEAYYALGIFYHSLGVNKNGVVINADYAQKAIDEMHFILLNFSATDQQALDALKAWHAQ